jgi:hypothetical protein
MFLGTAVIDQHLYFVAKIVILNSNSLSFSDIVKPEQNIFGDV